MSRAQTATNRAVDVRASCRDSLLGYEQTPGGAPESCRSTVVASLHLVSLASRAQALDDPDIAAEVNDRRQRMAKLQAQLAGARHAPRVLKDALDQATAHVRARFADLRALLADRGEGGRRLYQALFPDGLHFTPTEVHGRRVWRIEGAAVLDPTCDVTPPGITQRCTWISPSPSSSGQLHEDCRPPRSSACERSCASGS